MADATNTLFPTELAVKTYVDNQVAGISAPTIVSADAGNSITASGTDGGAFYDDSTIQTAIATNATAITAKEDSANKSSDITLADATNTLFPTELAVKTYVDNQIASTTNSNFAETDLELNGNRVHNLNGNDLVLQGLLGSGGNVGIGSDTNPPSAQLHVGGDVKASEFVSQIPGNAAAPDYTFEGDLDTGMFSTTAGNIGFSTDGTEALNIDATQNVTVRSNLTLEGTLTDNASSLGTDGQVLTKNSTGQVIWATPAEATVTATPGSIFFSDGTGFDENNAQLFWDVTGSSGSGALGIGTNTPGLTNKLTVSGSVRASGIQNSNGTAGVPSYRFTNNGDTGMFLADASGVLGFTTNNTEALRIDDNQNVGVGTTNPTSTLHSGGSFATSIIATSGNLTLTEIHHTIILTGDHNITLPTAGSATGRIYIIKNPITLGFNPSITGFIDRDGNSTLVTNIPVGVTQLQSDGTNWQQIN